MEKPLSVESSRILAVIKKSIASEQGDVTPGLVAEAAALTFVRLCERSDVERALGFLEVVYSHREHLRSSALAISVLEHVFSSGDNPRMLEMASSISEHSLKFSRPHFDLLLRNLKKAGSARIIEEYLRLDEYRPLMASYMESLPQVEHLSCACMFFDFVYLHAGLEEKLESWIEDGAFQDLERARKPYKYACDLLLKYTARKTEEPMMGKGELIVRKLKTLLNVPLGRGDKLIRVFSLLSTKDHCVHAISGERIMRVDDELRALIEKEVLDSDLTEAQVQDFVCSIGHLVLSEFMRLIGRMALRYMEGEEKFCSALSMAANLMGIENFFSLIDEEVDIGVWSRIVRSSANNDISMFIRLYEGCASELNRTVLLNSVEAFCYFATDHEELVERFLGIVKQHMGDGSVVSSLCTGLGRLISSHESNIKNKLILRNPIPVETSQRILQAVHNSMMSRRILPGYLARGCASAEELLFTLLGHDDLGLTDPVFGCIMAKKVPEDLGGFNLSSTNDALRIAKFLVPRIEPSFELASRLLELCLDRDATTQKRAYELLYHMRIHDKIDMCMCDTLFSAECMEGTLQPAQRSRIMFVHQMYQSGCLCFPDGRRRLVNRMLPLLILSLKTGDGRECSKEILSSLFLSFDESDYGFYCRLLAAAMGSEDVSLRCGVMAAVGLLMHSQRERLSQAFLDRMYEEVVACVRQGKEFARHALEFVDAYIRTSENIDPSRAFAIIEECMGGRHRPAAQSLIRSLVERGICVPPNILKFLKMRRRLNPLPVLQVTKKNDVIITVEREREIKEAFVRHRREARPRKKHKK
jgi:hypothetical protein